MDPTGLSGWGAMDGYATGPMPAGPAGPQPIWDDPSAGFSRMGSAFAGLPSDPLFMTSLSLLTNDGRLSPGAAYNALAMRQRLDQGELTKEEQRRYEREQRKMAESMRKLESIRAKLMGGAQTRTPTTVAPAAPASGAMTNYGLGAPFDLTQGSGMFGGAGTPLPPQMMAAQAGSAANAVPMSGYQPRGGGVPASIPLGGLQEPPPFDRAPAGAGAPTGAPLDVSAPEVSFDVALALMGGSKSDRAQGINILNNLLARRPTRPTKRQTLKDASGRQRFVDTGELVFPGLKSDPQAIEPFYDVSKPTEWQAGVKTMFRQKLAEAGIDPMTVTKAQADTYGAAAFRARQDALRALQLPDAAAIVPGTNIGATTDAAFDAVINRAASNAGARAANLGGAMPTTPTSVGDLPGFATQKKSTEAENKVRNAAAPMFDALVGMHNMEIGGFDPAKITIDAMQGDDKIGYASGFFAGSNEKTYALHRRNYTSEIARIKSGAVIKDQELWDEAKKNIPVGSDGPEQIVEKRYKRTAAWLGIYNQILDSHAAGYKYGGAEGIEGIRKMRDHVRDVLMPEALRTAEAAGISVDQAGLYRGAAANYIDPTYDQVDSIIDTMPDGATEEQVLRVLRGGR